jgi:hypothetical protein
MGAGWGLKVPEWLWAGLGLRTTAVPAGGGQPCAKLLGRRLRPAEEWEPPGAARKSGADSSSDIPLLCEENVLR